jgi:hypothetical protein
VIDQVQLLDWLAQKAMSNNMLLHAAYRGLADRIERGDFDVQPLDEVSYLFERDDA